jgi:hypothetical protein
MILEALAAVMSLSSEGEIANSPFIVPVAGCIMIAAIVGFNAWGSARKRQIESEERLAAIARGITPPPTREELELTRAPRSSSSSRRYSNIRLTGVILIAGAVGVILFFSALAAILHERDVLSGVACGLIPLGLGAGFLIYARLQKKDLEDNANAAASSTSLVG